MGKVRAVCISEKRGTQKKNIESAVFVENWGIEDTEQVRTGKLKILICKIVLVQTLKSCSITIFRILIQ